VALYGLWLAYQVFGFVSDSRSLCDAVSRFVPEESVQDQLNSAFKGKVLLVRNFYSGNDLVYDEDGAMRGDPKQGPWTLANVEITKVAVASQGIDIVGNRMGTLYKDGKPSFVRVGKLKIHVTKPISDVDTEATLHPIFKKIFIEAGEDLRSMVPDYWRVYLNGNDWASRSAAWQATVEEDNKPIFKKSDAPEVSAPRAVSWPDPGYTREAGSNHIEGVSTFWIVVDPTGTVTNIGILQPLGMGLDEQGVLALKQWKFQPAMKNGQPVRVEINVQITFRCCP
jgi:TonB family protein